MAESNAASNDDQRSNAVSSSERETSRSDQDKSSHPVLNWGAGVVSDFFQSVREDRTLPAIAREALKDVRSTVHEVFFGRGENAGELGAPFNPLASEIANDNTPQHGVHGTTPTQDAILGRSGGQTDPSPADQQADEVQIAGKSWVLDMLKRGKNETPYNRDRQHIKPEDEKEQRKEQERTKSTDRDDDGGRKGGGGGRGR